MRTEQMANRIKNQNFFQRNLFPRMFGWFLIRLVDREFECSTLEDVEGLCPSYKLSNIRIYYMRLKFSPKNKNSV